jgi:hypothetical protein
MVQKSKIDSQPTISQNETSLAKQSGAPKIHYPHSSEILKNPPIYSFINMV